MKRALLVKPIKLAGLFMFLLFSAALAQAQQATISGVVKDAKSEPMAGVSIAVKGTSNGTTTDENGKFTLVVSPDDKLVFSFIGYKSTEVAVGNQTNLSVTLEEDVAALSEVVVIGYGSVKKTDLTTSISSVNQKDLKTLPVAGIDQAIQGRLSGVTVTSNGGQPGGGVSVRVRGITSVNGNEPLYVIDGVPFQNPVTSLETNFLGGGSGQTSQSVLATLNPADIESIDVLKDASAQAIY
ncbi:MAG TPA: carboxypeptidase-like regulatory domain-containing protein, partial [Cyclobacteriaceae bacterium]|nr:carboxypeptidase-like regulatory domain-containing protein [Cyclobacteriaceae bacterium]